jgi:hypothetical protein
MKKLLLLSLLLSCIVGCKKDLVPIPKTVEIIQLNDSIYANVYSAKYYLWYDWDAVTWYVNEIGLTEEEALFFVNNTTYSPVTYWNKDCRVRCLVYFEDERKFSNIIKFNTY